MLDLEQRIQSWTATVTADLDHVTLDEIHDRAQGTPIDDAPAADPEHGSSRRWLAAAAVVVLLAATFGAIGLLRPDDSGVADRSATFNRLLELGPAEIVGWGPLVVDLESARRHVGLALPPADASVEVIDDYFTELQIRLGIDPFGWSSFGAHPDGRPSSGWWSNIGIDPSRITGAVSWGVQPDDRLVIIGEFDTDEIDDAARANPGSDGLTVGEHRGVTTYAWGEDFELRHPSTDVFPGFRNVQVAVVDDTVLLSRHIDSLHEMIDRVLDEGPSLADDDDVTVLLDALGERATFGSWFVGATQAPFTAWVMGSLGTEPHDGVQRYAAAVEPGTDVTALASQLQADVDQIVVEHLADLPELADLIISVTAHDGVVFVEWRGAIPNDPATFEAWNAVYQQIELAIGIVPMESLGVDTE